MLQCYRFTFDQIFKKYSRSNTEVHTQNCYTFIHTIDAMLKHIFSSFIRFHRFSVRRLLTSSSFPTRNVYRSLISVRPATRTSESTPTFSHVSTGLPKSSSVSSTAWPSICGRWVAFSPNSTPASLCCPAKTNPTSWPASLSCSACHPRNCSPNRNAPSISSHRLDIRATVNCRPIRTERYIGVVVCRRAVKSVNRPARRI